MIRMFHSRLRARSVLWLLVLTLCVGVSAAHAQDTWVPQICIDSLYDTHQDVDPDAWVREHGWVDVAATDESPRTVFIRGHHIVLDEDSFPALRSTLGQGLTGIERLVFDARSIHVNMELALDDGRFEFLADQVSFGPRGRVTLVQPPQDVEQSLRIVTNRLNLHRAPFSPFTFATRDWSPARSGSWMRDRTVNVVARDVVPPAFMSIEPGAVLDRPARFIRSLTLDDTFVSVVSNWRETYSVTVGDSAVPHINEVFSQSAAWPRHAVAGLSALHSFAPYDQVVHDYILREIDSIRTAVGASQDPVLVVGLEELESRIAAGVDAFGMDRFFVPTLRLEEEIASLASAVEAVFGCTAGECPTGGLLGDWDRLALQDEALDALADEVNERAALLAERLDDMRRRRSDLLSEAERRSTRHDQLLEDLDSKGRAVDDRRLTLRSYAEREVAEDERRTTFKNVLKLGWTAAGVASGQPALAAAGTTYVDVFFAGEGGDTVRPSEVVETFSDALAQHQQRAKEFNELQRGFHAAAADVDDGLDSLDEGAWISGISELSDAYRGARDSLSKLRQKVAAGSQSTEVAVYLREFEANDAILQELLAEIRSLSTQLGDEQTAWREAIEGVSDLDVEILSLSAELYRLQEPPVEDLGGPVWLTSAASEIRSSLLTDLNRRIVEVHRALQYAKGSEVRLPESLAALVASERSRLTGLQLDSAVDGASSHDASSLGEATERLRIGYQNVLAFLQAEARAVRSRPALGVSFATFDSRRLSNEARGHLIGQLNQDIREQIQYGSDSGRLHPLPYDFDLGDAGPLSVVVAVLKSASFTDESQLMGELEFSVYHPLHGNVRHSDGCYFVHSRVEGSGSSTGQGARLPRWSYVVTSGRTSFDYREQLDVAIQTGRPLSFSLPLEAPYYISVRVRSPSTWNPDELPELTRFSVDFVGRTLP